MTKYGSAETLKLVKKNATFFLFLVRHTPKLLVLDLLNSKSVLTRTREKTESKDKFSLLFPAVRVSMPLNVRTYKLKWSYKLLGAFGFRRSSKT
jgi:hypothetical protein